MKRRVSEELGGAGAKKLIVSGPWDLEIPTNVILYERSPSLLPHPQPEVRMVMTRRRMTRMLMQVEVVRSQLMYKLRQSYQEMCHSREGIDAPKESFNRSDTLHCTLYTVHTVHAVQHNCHHCHLPTVI